MCGPTCHLTWITSTTSPESHLPAGWPGRMSWSPASSAVCWSEMELSGRPAWSSATPPMVTLQSINRRDLMYSLVRPLYYFYLYKISGVRVAVWYQQFISIYNGQILVFLTLYGYNHFKITFYSCFVVTTYRIIMIILLQRLSLPTTKLINIDVYCKCDSKGICKLFK